MVKKPTGELYDEGKSIVFFPLRKGAEGKEYVTGVFGAEKKKAGQEGIVGYGWALVSTGLVVGGEAYRWVSERVVKREGQVKEVVSEKVGN